MNRRGIVLIRFLLALLACLAGVPGWTDDFPAPLRFTLDTLPEKDAWAGLTINGAKVGYAHFSVQPAGSGLYEIRSETLLVLRMLGFEKSIEMRGRDLVQSDLVLVDSSAEILMDGNRLALSGRIEGPRLLLSLENAGNTTRRELPVAGALFPASAIGLVPLLRGLEPGRKHAFSVFSPESMTVTRVDQQVEGATGSGPAAYIIRSRLEGQDSETWLDRTGHVVRETALGGRMQGHPETAEAAKAYAIAARAGSGEVMVDLSLVKADRAIPMPRRVGRMRVVLEGIGLDMPSGPGQRCKRGPSTWDCELDSGWRGATDGHGGDWLKPSFTVPSTNPAIVRLAQEIVAAATSPEAKVNAVLDWLEANIRKEAADGFTALDVLSSRRGECQGHSYLYAALARAAGIPTRVANGLVYSEGHAGFLYHTWAESFVDGAWRAVDPTFGQPVADATHIKILEGEEYGDIAPLVDLIGQVSMRIASFEYRR